MATNFPASLDSLTNPTSSDSLNSPSHSAQHANVNDAVEALQAKVGVDSSAVTSSLDYKVAQLESDVAGLVTGKILQVVSTFINGTFSTASTSFVDITGHTATITPSSASNKVLVLYTTHTGPAAGRIAPLNLVRDGSTIAQPTGGTEPGTAQFYGTHEIANVNFNYLDSPATTSAVVYKIQTKTDAGTLYVNRNQSNVLTGTSSLTLLEVSA